MSTTGKADLVLVRAKIRLTKGGVKPGDSEPPMNIGRVNAVIASKVVGILGTV